MRPLLVEISSIRFPWPANITRSKHALSQHSQSDNHCMTATVCSSTCRPGLVLSSEAALTAVRNIDEYGMREKLTSAIFACGKSNARADSGSTEMPYSDPVSAHVAGCSAQMYVAQSVS